MLIIKHKQIKKIKIRATFVKKNNKKNEKEREGKNGKLKQITTPFIVVQLHHHVTAIL